MSVWIVPPREGLIEPAIAPEIYVTGTGAIERIGDCIRFYLCAEQLSLHGDGDSNQVVVAKIMRPLSGVSEAICQMAMCMNGSCANAPVCTPPRSPWHPKLVT